VKSQDSEETRSGQEEEGQETREEFLSLEAVRVDNNSTVTDKASSHKE